MVEAQKESPNDIWDKLSDDALQLCVYLGPLIATSGNIEFLKAMAVDSDLEKAMGELSEFGVLEEVTFIKELKETTERLKPKRDFLSPNAGPITDEEREYLRAKHNLEDYERGPERFKSWEKPRYRLRQDFKEFVVSQLEDMWPPSPTK